MGVFVSCSRNPSVSSRRALDADSLKKEIIGKEIQIVDEINSTIDFNQLNFKRALQKQYCAHFKLQC
jgi:hypothetical protein